jgi:hypothetical protein
VVEDGAECVLLQRVADLPRCDLHLLRRTNRWRTAQGTAFFFMLFGFCVGVHDKTRPVKLDKVRFNQPTDPTWLIDKVVQPPWQLGALLLFCASKLN